MKTYNLFWSPEGRCIATVTALTAHAAIRKAPKPYSEYLGEIYAEQSNKVTWFYKVSVSRETAFFELWVAEGSGYVQSGGN